MLCHYETSRIMTLRLCRGRTTLGVGPESRVRVFRLVMCVMREKRGRGIGLVVNDLPRVESAPRVRTFPPIASPFLIKLQGRAEVALLTSG